ncbi:glycosyltransferase family 4 protein [candidate division KSB1 bacterium]|nr:glycosyltransferase family 4 protein [candidate division KSB1 bacterium]
MENNRPKLVYVIDTESIGGTEKYVLDLARHMVNDYNVTVVCPNIHAIDPWVVQLEGYGITVERDRLRCLINLVGFYRWRKRLKQAQIVHFVLPCPARSRVTILAAWLAHTPIRLLTLQLVTPVDHRFWPHRLFTSWSIRAAFSTVHRIITVSKYDAKQLQKMLYISEVKLTPIYNAVDTSRYSPGNRGEYRHPVMAVIGRLHRQKGHRILLEAIKDFPKMIGDFSLLLIGSGPDMTSLQAMVEEIGLSDYVEFMGRRHDIPGILRTVDIVVLPSLAEGFPFVMLEAMAVGKPIIASNLPGIRECVRDGITGLLVPVGEAAQLQDALIKLIRNPELATAMGRSAHHHVNQHFVLEHMISNTKLVYQSLISGKYNIPVLA